MAGDLGVRRKRRLTFGERAVMALAVLVFLACAGWLYGGSYMRQRAAALALARDAVIDGPPCPQLTAAAFRAQRLKVTHGTIYEDATFYRQFGHMSCSALRYGHGWSTAVYPVCQFTSPNTLRVTTAKGDWYFFPGFGRPATVATPHGIARCVMAANFTMKRLLEK